eukprot:NODE_404_length_9277_cov_0.359407.p3 type:complete len:212 gc:universal NODE_404_length_9277_cov_0.359407:7160-6525(-)
MRRKYMQQIQDLRKIELPKDGFNRADTLLALGYPMILKPSEGAMFIHRIQNEYNFQIKCLTEPAMVGKPGMLFGEYAHYCKALDIKSVSAPSHYGSCDMLFIVGCKYLKPYTKMIRKIKPRYIVFVINSFSQQSFPNLLKCAWDLDMKELVKPEFLLDIYTRLSVDLYLEEYFYVLNEMPDEKTESQPKGAGGVIMPRLNAITRHYASPNN